MIGIGEKSLIGHGEKIGICIPIHRCRANARPLHTISMNDDVFDPKMNPTEPLRRAIGDRYLTYALSTIMHRALPDARDGLKPVHRRILYAMRELKLASKGGFRKSAKISGDVMGTVSYTHLTLPTTPYV